MCMNKMNTVYFFMFILLSDLLHVSIILSTMQREYPGTESRWKSQRQRISRRQELSKQTITAIKAFPCAHSHEVDSITDTALTPLLSFWSVFAVCVPVAR